MNLNLLKSNSAYLIKFGLVVFLGLSSNYVFAERSAQEQRNIDIVVEFYNTALNKKDVDKAKTYFGSQYIQHNPVAQDGIDGFVGFINYLKNQFPENNSEIKKSFADGDHVFLHVHSKRTPDSRGNAIIEIFRLENGKIVEHWDVIQEIPEKAANDNTMF